MMVWYHWAPRSLNPCVCPLPCPVVLAEGVCTEQMVPVLGQRQWVMKAGSMERFYLKEVLVSK